MKNINIAIEDETHRAAKSAAAIEGIGLGRWIERTLRRVCGLPELNQKRNSAARESGLTSAEDQR